METNQVLTFVFLDLKCSSQLTSNFVYILLKISLYKIAGRYLLLISQSNVEIMLANFENTS
jgi:hypothetical protein